MLSSDGDFTVLASKSETELQLFPKPFNEKSRLQANMTRKAYQISLLDQDAAFHPLVEPTFQLVHAEMCRNNRQ